MCIRVGIVCIGIMEMIFHVEIFIFLPSFIFSPYITIIFTIFFTKINVFRILLDRMFFTKKISEVYYYWDNNYTQHNK